MLMPHLLVHPYGHFAGAWREIARKIESTFRLSQCLNNIPIASSRNRHLSKPFSSSLIGKNDRTSVLEIGMAYAEIA
jgi:hypothetical protein